MRSLADWFFALFVTAAMAVVLLGVSQVVGDAGAAAEAVADTVTVAVDAGHGGFDGGAVGTNTGVIEAGLNLAVAKLVKEDLTDRGLSVVMTRTDENALSDTKKGDMAVRRTVLRGDTVDLVVSIHMNKFPDRSVSGAMAYYMQGSEEGQKLAQCVIDSICDSTGRSRRLANPGDYFVLRECAAPAVLVECGFLSNAADEKQLIDEEYQAMLAQAVADGIMNYLDQR